MGTEKSGHYGTHAVEHAVLLARAPKIDGALANKVIVRVRRNTWNGLDLSKFYADILGLNALRTQANLDCLIQLRGETEPREAELTPLTAA